MLPIQVNAYFTYSYEYKIYIFLYVIVRTQEVLHSLHTNLAYNPRYQIPSNSNAVPNSYILIITLDTTSVPGGQNMTRLYLAGYSNTISARTIGFPRSTKTCRDILAMRDAHGGRLESLLFSRFFLRYLLFV